MIPIFGTSLELVLLVIAGCAEAFLAFAVYQSNTKSASNRIFALLSIVTLLWLIANYATNHLASEVQPMIILAINRTGIFFAAPMSTLFMLLAHTIPSDELRMGRRPFYTVVGLTLLMMLINASPLAFTGVLVDANGAHPTPGPGLLPFSIISTVFSILAVYFLIRSYYRTSGATHEQIKLVLLGMYAMLLLIILTILVPIIFSNSLQLLALTPIYTLIFLGMTAYAITKYQLFNIKIIVTEALTITIWLVLFAKLFGETSLSAVLVDGLVFVFMIVFGILLIRSVIREVRQREEIERLSNEKSEFMSFASHEIRNPITAMRGYASLIADGTAGEISAQVLDIAQKILVNGDTVLALISEFLNKSKLELGQISYNVGSIDLGKTITSIGEGFKAHAKERGLSFDIKIDFPGLMAYADDAKLREVVGNLLDNSMKYTKEGGVMLTVEKRNGVARVIVSDTGVGIPQETISHLFQKFTRADAQKMNLLGTGLGLYLAKTFVEGMGGKIWAESDGEGKGSRFIIELHTV